METVSEVDFLQEGKQCELKKGQIYAIPALLKAKYSFGRIKINRDIDKRQVSKKIASIKQCGGIITPFLVVRLLSALRII